MQIISTFSFYQFIIFLNNYVHSNPRASIRRNGKSVLKSNLKDGDDRFLGKWTLLIFRCIYEMIFIVYFINKCQLSKLPKYTSGYNGTLCKACAETTQKFIFQIKQWAQISLEAYAYILLYNQAVRTNALSTVTLCGYGMWSFGHVP